MQIENDDDKEVYNGDRAMIRSVAGRHGRFPSDWRPTWFSRASPT